MLFVVEFANNLNPTTGNILCFKKKVLTHCQQNHTYYITTIIIIIIIIIITTMVGRIIVQ